MNYSKKINTIGRSWGGVLAITVLLILVVFALFNTAGKKNGLTGAGANAEWEDAAEHPRAQQRNIVVKKGQKLVVF